MLFFDVFGLKAPMDGTPNTAPKGTAADMIVPCNVRVIEPG